MTSIEELTAVLKITTEQRNQASNQAAALGAKAMLLEAENQTLRKQLADLQPKPTKPAKRPRKRS